VSSALLGRTHPSDCTHCAAIRGNTWGRLAALRHGHARIGRLTPTYITWRNMINRCTNPAIGRGWQYYGGRGIIVCDRWMSFENFLADMGSRPEGLTLDRLNSDSNYEPGNCRWATRSEQTRGAWKRRKLRLP
jgi:hypothetical protein